MAEQGAGDSVPLAFAAGQFDTTVADLTFTAVTQGRRDAPRHARIAVVADLGGGNYRAVRNATIRDNRIVNGGPPGSDQANGASATGIFLMRAERFLVANNMVVRTLADGIHITGGSRDVIEIPAAAWLIRHPQGVVVFDAVRNTYG